LTKQELRKAYILKRQSLSERECEELNLGLLEQFKRLDFSSISYLHIFLPIINRKEPDTLLLIAWLKQLHPKIKIVYPQININDYSMESYADDPQLILEANPWGITEPIKGRLVSRDKIDMVIVPLLIFDKQGYRVGYGKGFYDRFMAQCRADTQFIGLSFFDPVDKIDDWDQFDIRMHQCLTPAKRWDW